MNPAQTDPREDLAFAAGLNATVYGLALVESMRTAAQMTSVVKAEGSGRAPLNVFGHADHAWTHEDRDVVTPANDLLYSIAWLDLRRSPVILSVPAEAARYWVMALLDAYTNNFQNIGPRLTGGKAMRFAIAALDWEGELPEGVLLVRSPTPLVWVLGRILVTDANDLRPARELQQQFRLQPLVPGDDLHPHYMGYVDPQSQAGQWPQLDASSCKALNFFDNLARGLAENPPPASDKGLLATFASSGIRPGASVKPELLEPAVLRGLVRGHAAGLRLIEQRTLSRRAKAWGMNNKLGRFGTDYLARAAAAAKGLGGLAADEALYAMSDFDDKGLHLEGSKSYRLFFPGDALPACDAFWSVSLYGEDRFFVDNPARRYAIGDRSAGLIYEPDGSLQIFISHTAPVDDFRNNWLPAPEGRFYLVLRMYHPREEALSHSYHIPALQAI